MTVSINGDTGVSAVQDNIVTADKIAAGAVTVADIADGAITSTKLASGLSLSGNVLRPDLVAFFAWNSANIACSTLSADQIMVWDSTAYNDGNHYSTSTGKFTVPVSGVYNFSIHCRIDSIETGNNNYYHGHWAINDGTIWAGATMRTILASSTSSPYEAISDNITVKLAANDTVAWAHGDSTLSGASAGSASYVNKQCRFSGFLVG